MSRLRSWIAVCSLGGCAVACAASASEESETGEDAVVAELASCASPLMRAIYDGAKTVVQRGPIPEELFATSKNRVDPTVAIEGPEIFPKMADVIARAEREVLFQTFVWDDSAATRSILDGLGRLQTRLRGEDRTGKPPVIAYFVVDASKFGVPSAKPSDVGRMIAAGLATQNLDPALVDVRIATFEHTTVGNNHSKTLVVDGREAVITGANPQPQHDPLPAGTAIPGPEEAPLGPWHDTGYHVEGEVARTLAGDFDYAWNRSHRWMCGTEREGKDCEPKTEPIAHVTLASTVGDGVCAPVLVIGRKRNANPFNNRTDNTQDQAFLAAFRNAQTRIRIETPNLNDDHAKKALLEALEHGGPEKKGVVVEIILAKGFNEKEMKFPGQGGGNEDNVKELYAKLADHGVADACNKLRVRWYSFCPRGTSCKDSPRPPIFGGGPRANHSKYATIDGTVAIVGSTNLDTQSWNNAHEVDLVIDDPAVIKRWDEQVFERDFENGVVADPCAGHSP